MSYLRVAADAELKPWVEAIWVQHDERDARRERFAPTRVLPTGKTELIFQYAEPFAEATRAGGWRALPDAYVCGARSRPVDVAATGRTGLVIVGLHPWGLSALLRDAVAQLSDDSVDATALLPAALVRELLERLRAAGGAEARVALVRGFLAQRLRAARLERRLMAAATWLAASGGRQPIGALAARVELSRAELSRRFTRAIGIGPKRFADVLRFQRAVGLRRAGAGWGAVAQTCGYYDQAHLIRSFAAHSGHTFGRFPIAPTAALGGFFNRPDSAHCLQCGLL